MFIPKFISKWLAIFRGEVSPVLILLSVLLGFWFGVTPGFYGLHAALLMLVLILNTHIGLFLLAGTLGKSLSLAAAPVLYHVGIFVQGALAPLLALLAAVPIVGITDFSRYAVAGAVVVGPIVGLILGAGLAKSVLSYRKAWLKLEENSETFKRWHEKKWVRFLDRILVGKSAKDVRQTLTKKTKIVRRAGVALVAGLAVIAVIGAQFLTDERLIAYAEESLTKLNGAQVDIERLSLQPFSGKLAAKGVQVTDPDNPQNNRVSIGEFQTQASWYGLLTGKVVMDNLEISALKFDQPRAQPGAVFVDTDEEDESSAGFDWGGLGLPDLDARTLESYFKNGQEIRETLAKIKPYLPEGGAKTKPAPAGPPEEYLAYLRARAPSVPTPRIIAKRVVLDHVELPFGKLADSKIECLNLNDAPSGARLPVTVKVTSNTSSDWIQIVSRYDAPEQGAEVTAEFSNIDLAALQAGLNSKNPVVFTGGTASVKIDGRAGRDMIDLGITVATANMAVESAGGGALGLDPQITAEALKVIQNINTTVRLVGPLTQPKLVFDVPALREEFQAALIKAGKDQLAGRLGDVIGKELPAIGDIPKDLDAAKIGDVVGDLLGKDEPADKNDKEDEKKDGKKLIDGLGGLLGGDKSDDKDEDDN